MRALVTVEWDAGRADFVVDDTPTARPPHEQIAMLAQFIPHAHWSATPIESLQHERSLRHGQ